MNRVIFIYILLIAVGCNSNDKEASPESLEISQKIDGEKLFKSYCATCHRPGQDFTGPNLKGSLKRWGDKKEMYDFIRNPVQSQTQYARALKNKWAPNIMPIFKLSDAQLDALMKYWEKAPN